MKILHKASEIETKRIIFFDLDGTLINTSSGKTFPEDLTDFRIKKNVLDNILKMKKVEYIFIASNQAGIGTFISREQFELKFKTIMNFIKNYIYLTRSNIVIDGLYCGAKGSNSKNRKPNTGMLERSMKGIDIPKEDILMIGDASGIHNETRDDFSDSDLRTARNFEIDYMDIQDFEAFED